MSFCTISPHHWYPKSSYISRAENHFLPGSGSYTLSGLAVSTSPFPTMYNPRQSLSSIRTEHSPDSKARGSLDTQYDKIHHNRPGNGAQGTLRSTEEGTDISFAGDTAYATEKPSFPSQISHYFLVELDPRRADVILIVCGFVSGLVDGLSFNAWGSFSSMQTGMLSASRGASRHG